MDYYRESSILGLFDRDLLVLVGAIKSETVKLRLVKRVIEVPQERLIAQLNSRT